jgi:hypothetical protein
MTLHQNLPTLVLNRKGGCLVGVRGTTRHSMVPRPTASKYTDESPSRRVGQTLLRFRSHEITGDRVRLYMCAIIPKIDSDRNVRSDCLFCLHKSNGFCAGKDRWFFLPAKTDGHLYLAKCRQRSMVLSTGKNRWPFVPGGKRLVAGYCDPNSILFENDEFPT